MQEHVLGPSSDPLGQAFSLFGHEIQALQNSTNIQALTVSLPVNSKMVGLYVTGASGNLSHRLSVANPGGGNNLSYAAGSPWKVRWDWSESNGSHVNAEIGTGLERLKIAFRASPEGIQNDAGNASRYWTAIQQQTQATNWTGTSAHGNEGKRLVEWWSARFHQPRWGVYSGETPYQ